MLKTLLILLIFNSSAYAKPSFEAWKKEFANKAVKRGLDHSFVTEQLKSVSFDPEVVEKDRSQVILSKDKDYNEFMQRWLRNSPSRIEQGRKVLKENIKLLTQIEKKYKVDKEAIVSLWGVETFYGKITGSHDLITALATLTYDGRRKRFFEIQLNAALRLLQQGHITRDKLKGSWAGATGQCQFMPSNINAYAQDFDGDGRKDIWTNKADIFASIANFLKKVGWKYNKEIGSLAINTKNKKIVPNRFYSKNTYHKLGLRTPEGEKFQGKWRSRRVAEIPMKNSPLILRGSNYKPLLNWNNSSLFAAFNIIMMEGLAEN